MQLALLSGDESALREQVHQFSGLAVMVGLERLEGLVRAIALAVKGDQMSEAWRLYWALKGDFDGSDSICDLS